MTKKQYIGIGIGIIGIALIAFVIMKDTKKTTSINTENTATSTGSTFTLPDGSTIKTPDGMTIEQVPLESTKIPQSSLSRPIAFSGTIDPQMKQIIPQKVAELQQTLKNNPKDVGAWITLGMYYKVAGDYEGAKLYWTYVSKISPTDFISLGNMGNMYAYQLRDVTTAQEYYNKAIKNGPTQIYLYIQLAEILRDFNQDMVGAKAVIDRGLVANPNDTDLVAFRASLK